MMDLGFYGKEGHYGWLNALSGNRTTGQIVNRQQCIEKDCAYRDVGNKNNGVSFGDTILSKTMQAATKQGHVSGISFRDRWQARFPGGYYHVMDASKIPQGTWQRTDFPFEKFFAEKVDESVLQWTSQGAAPSMLDPKVQSRLDSVLGQHSIVVPPALEEKLKNDPALADKIMANIDYLFQWNGYPIPGRINSALIVLDENGEVARWNLISGGGGITGPTEAEQREFELEQKAKKERRARYARIVEESALKRKLQEEERNRQYYEEDTVKALPLSSVYEKRMREAQCVVKTGAYIGGHSSLSLMHS